MTDTITGKKKPDSSGNIRELALDVLYQILEKGGYSHVVLNQALSKYQYLGKQDRAFVTRVTEGTLEYLLQIDYVLNRYSNTGTEKMKPLIRTLMRMSVYQILYMDRIPDSAVCNEAVKLAQKRHFQGLKGFVNGVLRTVSRQKDHLVFPDLSVKYSMPSWILSLWSQVYDQETIERMLSYFLAEHPLTVRCNRTCEKKETIIASLESQGVTVRESSLADSILYLEHLDYPEGLEAFRKGWIQIQDVSSCLPGLIACPRKGDTVLDVCGAPGGKALHIADLLEGTGHVEVRDISSYKLNMINENIARSGFTNITASLWDAAQLDENFIEKADVVIADLPCSGLGVLGRKPDIKEKMTLESLESLAALQRNILSVVHRYVKPGGILVYSTCTIDRKENEENVAWFLERYPFRPVNIDGRLGEELKSDTMKEGYIQLLPGIHPCDGFFLSVMQRI